MSDGRMARLERSIAKLEPDREVVFKYRPAPPGLSKVEHDAWCAESDARASKEGKVVFRMRIATPVGDGEQSPTE